MKEKVGPANRNIAKNSDSAIGPLSNKNTAKPSDVTDDIILMSTVYELIANLLKALFDKLSPKNLLQSTADFLHITKDQLMTNITPILRGNEKMV